MENKYHQARLKSIAQTLSTAETNKKAVVAMVTKMENTLAKLQTNVANLDEKIAKYKSLYDNVKLDPEYKLNKG